MFITLRHLSMLRIAVPALPLVAHLDMKVAQERIPGIYVGIVLRVGEGRIDLGIDRKRRIPYYGRRKRNLGRSVIEVVEAIAAIQRQRPTNKRAARRVECHKGCPDVSIQAVSWKRQERIGSQDRIDGMRDERLILEPPAVRKLTCNPGM